MSENQTRPTGADVEAFLTSVADARRQDDARRMLSLMQEVTGEPPVMWGPSIVGFGSVHYRYASGREGDMPVVSFSPRQQALTLYGVIDPESAAERVQQLGKVTTGKGCLYVKRLDDVELPLLRTMIETAWNERTPT
jgi:hypothetical protein